jgi:t-SNARE complex subunit (syntaxin)
MAPRKTQKKSDDIGESSNPNSDVLSDTTPHVVDSVRSWMQIFEILEHEVRNCLDDFGNERTDKTENKLKDIAEVELHKIATRSKLMPYNDMINWALMNTDVQTRSIMNHQKVVIGSFRPEHIQVMYKLSHVSKYIYNVEFIEEFQ